MNTKTKGHGPQKLKPRETEGSGKPFYLATERNSGTPLKKTTHKNARYEAATSGIFRYCSNNKCIINEFVCACHDAKAFYYHDHSLPALL